MNKFFEFSWVKVITGTVVAIALYILSLGLYRGCGIDVVCPNPEPKIVQILAGIVLAYVVSLVVIKLINKKK